MLLGLFFCLNILSCFLINLRFSLAFSCVSCWVLLVFRYYLPLHPADDGPQAPHASRCFVQTFCYLEYHPRLPLNILRAITIVIKVLLYPVYCLGCAFECSFLFFLYSQSYACFYGTCSWRESACLLVGLHDCVLFFLKKFPLLIVILV